MRDARRDVVRGSVAVGVAALSLVTHAQQRDPQVFRAKTELVRLDVVVVDAEGHAVHGLTADDFEIRDRGQTRTIAAFEEISHEHAAESPPPIDLKRDVADNVASHSDRLIVLVLDDLHFQKKTDEVKAMARRVVAGIGPGASLALITTSGSFGVEPTDDRALLLAEIDRFLDKFDPEGPRLAPGAERPRPAPIRNVLGEVVAVRGPQDPASFFGDMGTYKIIQDVAKKVRADAGRRNAFVWISGGMNAPVGDPKNGTLATDHDNWYLQSLAGLLDALQKSNVAAYGISIRESSSALLKTVADASGGFVMDATHFDRDLPRLIDDLDHYYLLAFYPDEESSHGFHPVDVTVRRQGVAVRYRHGYDAGAAPSKPRNSDALARLSEGNLPVADLPLRMLAAPMPASRASRARTLVALEVRAPRAALVDGQGLSDTLRYEIWAVDLKRKKVVTGVAHEARLILDPAEARAAARDPLVYQVHAALELDPGRYQLRASASSAKAGRSGSVYLETLVPDFQKAPLEVGAIQVIRDRADVPVVRSQIALHGFPAAVTLDREFGAGEHLRIQCDVLEHRSSGASVTVDLFTAAGDSARRFLDKRIASSEPHRIDLGLDLAGLAPGGYRLRVTAEAAGHTVTRELAFVVTGTAAVR